MAEEPTSSLQSDGLQPGHDIFCTPRNDASHTTKLYSELNVARQEIRLINLLPGTGDDVIECTLLSGAPLLDLKGRYTAPSYCAGSAENTEHIVLNGAPFNVFANLAHTLREVRHFWQTTYGDRECLLWIDQISINQYDINERSHQVCFMREIYQYAEQVLVCLSTEKADARGMRWLIDLARDVRPRAFDTIPREKPHFSNDVDSRRSSQEERAKVIRCDHEALLASHLCKNAENKNTDFLEGWLASLKIIEMPWFTRAWVFQEFIVAANVEFMYSGEFASWQTLLPIWMAICSTHKAQIMRTVGCVLGTASSFPAPSVLAERNLYRIFLSIAGSQPAVAMRRVTSMMDTKAHWRGNKDLKELLMISRDRHTSDPRDKVFAYIGLAHSAYGISPNYLHSINQVLTEATMSIIKTEDSLEVLRNVIASKSRSDSSLPSWVVDWTCEQEHCGVLSLLPSLDQNGADASFHTLRISKVNYQALQISGILVDRFGDRSDSKARHVREFRMGWRSPMYFLGHLVPVCLGDEIWMLRGCRTPLILRAQGNSVYVLVSAATYGPKHARLGSDAWLANLLRGRKDKQGGWRVISII